jgi:hypothetical protein
MGRGGELSAVAVGMAGGAGELARNVHRLAALGLVALGATEFGVFPFERKRALAVGFAVEASGFEARHLVAGRTVRTGRSRGELAFVRIFMAIPATLVRHGAAEIGALMTFGARQFRVLSHQGKLRSGVIEVRAGVVVLKAVSVVTVVAGTLELDFLEGAAVGILVTVLAAAVGQAFELGILLAGARSVALLAGLLLVQPAELEVGSGMIESGSGLEAVLRVAVQAIGAELALMLVLVAVQALAAKTEERPVQIFQLDLGLGSSGDMSGNVTLLALLLGVLAGQGKAGLGEVIELLTVEINQRSSLPLMFLMTTPAIGLAGKAFVVIRVKARVGLHPAADFGVTLETFEAAGSGSKLVTGRAFGHALQLLVSARQRAGRDLRLRQRGGI